ncbi:DUF3152 domain-containing protein [Streptomyces sp. ISL-100]|uniref:DUF3152 domain-containing protein n=1 Tax=Streptomyces sp. ISL-100 TaxID=2819173 RepID=UPI001BE81B06|nr:DUF3152 domain-containing protein [Streptomyces sp. ISL-100]MBT2397058.1 DUF3152 domain-containing protein [Streptomyces sp. ISL-100]
MAADQSVRDADEDTYRIRVPVSSSSPSSSSSSSLRSGSPGRAQRRQAGKRTRTRRRRRAGLGALVLVVAVVAGAVLLDLPWAGSEAPAAGGSVQARATPSSPAPRTSPAASPKARASASPKASPSLKPSRTATATASTPPPAVPASGPGTFTVARAGASTTGGGSRYRVEVEDGIGVDPDKAAEDIAGILADPRGWAYDGTHSFRQVADDSAGLVIRVATPATTDRLCGSYGLNTHGEVNCRGGEKVMVNLKRWQLGSPQFDGPVSEYRALIINHEVGHWLGRGHETCPGPGRPAPAMMQQIKGLQGCVANAWPYDENGRYLGGPSVP